MATGSSKPTAAKKMMETLGGEALPRDSADGPGETEFASGVPYIASVTIEGVCPVLFHRWSCVDIADKAAAAKGSAMKKTDNVESYITRNAQGELCLPGEYLGQSLILAAKFLQDPRSPRKSKMDIYKAGVFPLTELAPIYVEGQTAAAKEWDYLDQRRVMVQRNGVTRSRPAFNTGWRATVEFQVTLSQYIPKHELHETLSNAGKFVGVADYRPRFGRFIVTNYEVMR